MRDRLVAWTPPADRLDRWAAAEPVLAGLRLPGLRRLLHDRTVAHDRKDDVLAALVRLAATDDEAVTALAACLLPGLRAVARRIAAGHEPTEVWSELLAQLVAHVRRYDLDRRPRRIAANLLLDTMSHTLAWLRRERRWQDARQPLDDADLPTAPPPTERGCPVGHALAAGLLSSDDATLVLATRTAGFTLAETAALLGLGYEAAKKRRQPRPPPPG